MEIPSREETPSVAAGEAPATRTRDHRIRLSVWAALAAGLLLFILFGSVSAISYRYYSFSGRVVRLDPHRTLVDIWRDGIAALPAFAVDWLPGAVIIACLIVAVACAIGGMWMLLVQGGTGPRRSTRAG
jgi:hypothetical protein